MARLMESLGVSVAEGIDPLKVILERLEETGQSRYWLVKQLQGKLSANMVYSYLRGDMDLTGRNLVKIFNVLGIRLQSGRRRKSEK